MFVRDGNVLSKVDLKPCKLPNDKCVVLCLTRGFLASHFNKCSNIVI